MENKNAIPTDKGLQQYAISNRDFETPLFETISLADGSGGIEPISKVAIPSTMAIEEAKSWVDNGSKL